MVLKYVRGRYGIVAHQAAAEAGLAPPATLTTLAGGWLRVEMPDIGLSDATAVEAATRPRVLAAVNAAVRALHALQGNGFVHGDLRAANVLWDEAEGRALLIDFDWAGPPDAELYPLPLNGALPWARGAAVGMPITKAHDLERISNEANFWAGVPAHPG